LVKITGKNDSFSFAVRVQPRASQSGIAGELDGALKIRLAAPPVDGEANEALIRLLARFFNVPRAQVEIISGQTSKHKVVRVDGFSAIEAEEMFKAALGG